MTLVVERRFRGPAESGNGGYVSGLLAQRVGADAGGSAAVVTLRMPPPLETPLAIVADGDGAVRLLHGNLLVAEAARSRIHVDAVPPVDVERAAAAEASYEGFVTHPFPTCFVCGPDREPGDGILPELIAAARRVSGSMRTSCSRLSRRWLSSCGRAPAT